MKETCDKCGKRFVLDTDCFIGDMSGDTNCSAQTKITTLCADCTVATDMLPIQETADQLWRILDRALKQRGIWKDVPTD
jgi:hypothetical protein